MHHSPDVFGPPLVSGADRTKPAMKVFHHLGAEERRYASLPERGHPRGDPGGAS